MEMAARFTGAPICSSGHYTGRALMSAETTIRISTAALARISASVEAYIQY
jgi:hypothetical protein